MIILSSCKDKATGSMTLSLKGHSGMAEPGKDIVCASATMLAYTLADNVARMFEEDKLKRQPQIKMNRGDVYISARPKGEFYDEVNLVYQVILSGYALLCKNYPQYIKSDKA